MATAKSAWGVEVGSFGIKAVRLERQGNEAKVTDFAVIPHSRVLSTPEVDADEVVRMSLGQFINSKAVDKTRVAISVPGNIAFSTFTRLPPHEPKQTPNLVRFEAEQQIPFPITEVVWDFETFRSDESPEVEVGIFALQRSVLDDRLELYAELGVEPDMVTVSPLAVYNAVAYDLNLDANSKPIVILDIATRHSDLIIAEGGRCWFRRLPVGGHNFTAAISAAFKISYAKAEQLKQEGATGKYAKQVMQAMRPEFEELLVSVKRSLDYYKTNDPLNTVLGVGSTFRIPGLRKFLGVQLKKDVIRLDEFQRIGAEGSEGADFASNTVNLWTAYGLALQEIGLAPIDVNLAPVEVLRQQLWASKRPWFVGAAAVAFLAGGAMFGRYFLDAGGLRLNEAKALGEVAAVDRNHKRFKSSLDSILAQATGGSLAASLLQLDEYREVWPALLTDVTDAVAEANDPDLLSKSPAQIRVEDPGEREMAQLLDFGGNYRVEGAGDSAKRVIDVRLEIAYSNSQTDYLNTTVCDWLRKNTERDGVPFKIVAESISFNPSEIVTDTIQEDGSVESTGGNRGSETRGASRGTGTGHGTGRGGGSRGGSRGTIIGGDGAGGMIKDEGETVDAPSGGQLAGGGTQGGSVEIDETEFDYENRGSSNNGRSGDGDRRAEQVLGELDSIAPIPSKPVLFDTGTKTFRGFVTFTIELLDDAGNAATEGTI